MAGFHGRRDIEKFVFADGQAAEDAGLYGNGRDAVGDAVEINLGGLNRFGLFFFFLFTRLLIAGFARVGLRCIFLIVFLFVFVGR
ncbi:MAG: hypothetical protein ACREIW_13945, partial [Chthoniobacterales bacterium]